VYPRRVPSDRSSELDDTAVTAPIGHAPGAPDHDPLPEVSARRYRVADEVGRGGLGRVLRAHDAFLGRAVAIKEILVDDEHARRRFVREVMITARLQHPSIVPVYEAGRWANQAPFYAMKLVAGRPLSELIAAARSFDERLGLVPAVLAVADAIAYAHGERIIHRDLKPHNVLIGAHGETVVIDWGLAKDLAIDDRDAPAAGPTRDAPADQTAAGAMLGTPAYMAPEQALGKTVDERADVYALGAILYHVVAGTGPHHGDNAFEVIGRAAQGDIVPVTAREPRVAGPLAAIIGKAMALDPAARYPSAQGLADDLRRFTTDQLVAAYRYTVAQRLGRWLRRHRAAVIAIALLATFAAWASWSVREQRAAAQAAAQRELAMQAAGIEHDVAFSLDQAAPILDRLRALADPELELDDVAPRLRDLATGRPGVANVSVGFSSGLMRGTFARPDGELAVQESRVGDRGTQRRNYRVLDHGVALIDEATTDYDVRRRPHYALADRARARAWTPPRTYFTTHATGLTCVDPIVGADGALRAVTTVDFDVGALSAFVARAPLAGARTLVFSGDGTILAFPTGHLPDTASKQDRLLRHEDFGDPAVEALFAALGHQPSTSLRYLELTAAGDDYLAAVAPIGGRRAGIAAPLDWYVATLVPADTLLGAADARQRQSMLALYGIFAIAAATAAVFVWRRVRGRR
jgi:hypothetical protein